VREFEGPRGTLEITHINLFGWGKNEKGLDRALSLQFRGGLKEQRFQATYREPRLFNWEYEGFGTVFIEKAQRRFYDANQVDFTLQVVKRLSTRDGLLNPLGSPSQSTKSLLFTASYDTVNLRDIKFNPVLRRFPEVEGIIQIAQLGTSFVGDWRDDAIDPRRGPFTTTTFEVANRKWGSEVNFTSFFTQTNLYRPFPNGGNVDDPEGIPVLAFAKRIGWNQPYGGDTELPISERYFAGGSTTLRGFDLDEAGPPGGGQLMTIFNLEYRVPFKFLPIRRLGGAAFYDTGNVFERAVDFSFSDFTHSVGGGLRYQTPLGPVRLDFGINLTPKLRVQSNGTLLREERFQVFFTLGQAF
jgi:outer membrane protein assembly factor BamA